MPGSVASRTPCSYVHFYSRRYILSGHIQSPAALTVETGPCTHWTASWTELTVAIVTDLPPNVLSSAPPLEARRLPPVHLLISCIILVYYEFGIQLNKLGY